MTSLHCLLVHGGKRNFMTLTEQSWIVRNSCLPLRNIPFTWVLNCRTANNIRAWRGLIMVCTDMTLPMAYKNISMTTKPRLAFHGKLGFNSEITKYELEMEPAMAQVILKLKEHMQTGNGCFFFLRRKCHASKRPLYHFRG